MRNKRKAGETHIVDKLAVHGGPAYLHDAICDDEDFVKPDANIHLARTSDTLKRVRITPGLQ